MATCPVHRCKPALIHVASRHRQEKTMKNIKVLGSGCRNCEITANVIAQAAQQAEVPIELEKVTDIADIMAYGVISTPGVVIDGEVVHSGGIPGPEQVRQWLAE
jgi:small redox-active disulfide protein 2